MGTTALITHVFEGDVSVFIMNKDSPNESNVNKQFIERLLVINGLKTDP